MDWIIRALWGEVQGQTSYVINCHMQILTESWILTFSMVGKVTWLPKRQYGNKARRKDQRGNKDFTLKNINILMQKYR